MRLCGVVLAATLIMGAGPAHGSAADAGHSCQRTQIYEYCGEHVPDLPLRFRVIGSDARLHRAAAAVADSWNRLWYVAAAPWLEPDDPTCPAICIDPAGSSTVSIGSFPCPADPGAIATACLTYVGSSGHAAHHIARVDVVLRPGLDWRDGSGAELITGEVQGLVQLVNPLDGRSLFCSTRWWDLGSALAHEFGHALGLEHVEGEWPSSLLDLAPARQTMYASAEPCSTIKRTPEEGDLLGLRAAAADSAHHR